MAVIIREDRLIGDRMRHDVAVYESTRPVGAAARTQALRLDEELKQHMAAVVDDVRRGGWLALKGRPGVVRLWWEVGRRIRQFADSLEVGPEQDRPFLFRAMYDHAGGLAPGKVGARAERLANSHFYYCYLLGKYEWEKVDRFGDWTSWVEVFDSLRMRNDPRIIDWLVERSSNPTTPWLGFMGANRMGWFRPLAKVIRAAFTQRDSTGLESEELYEELDAVFAALADRGAVKQP